MKSSILWGSTVLSAALMFQPVMAFSLGGALKAAQTVNALKGITLPDFQTASVADLAKTAAEVFTNLQSLAGGSPIAQQGIKAVTDAVASNNTQEALGTLSTLSGLLKNIPGADKLLASGQQVVSAWALKQAFDGAQISGILGALQKNDSGAIASTATQLLGSDGLSANQTGLVQGVLKTFGL